MRILRPEIQNQNRVILAVDFLTHNDSNFYKARSRTLRKNWRALAKQIPLVLFATMPTPSEFTELQCARPPNDPVSSLVFYRDAQSRRAAHLLVASWDKVNNATHLPQTVQLQDWSRCAAGPDEVTVLQTFTHPAAVLDVCWIDETFAASACLDRRVRL